MHSFILTGGNKPDREAYLTTILSPTTQLIRVEPDKSSITIKQIQALWEPLKTSARLPRLVWIDPAQAMTIPAQNALLKNLEEPPENTSFYLSCDSPSSLLPTIRSRCLQIVLPDPRTDSSSAELLSELKTIMSLSPGDRIQSIAKQDRTAWIAWITQIELALRHKLKTKDLEEKHASTLAKIASLAQQTHLQLLSNCSLPLTLANFYLLLPHTRSRT